MSPAKITIRMEGLPALLRKLEPNTLLGDAWTAALTKASKQAEEAMRRFSPGTSKRGLKSQVQKRPVPLWAAARMPARTKGKDRRGRPFRILGALHGSKRIRYHYRSGPLSGQLTYAWHDRARESIKKIIANLIIDAGRQIEARWNRG